MDATRGAGRKTPLDLLVGIEAGVIGAGVSLIWFALVSPLQGEPWWLIPNLFASHFYNYYQVHSGPGSVTWVGASVHVIASGLVGALNGVLTPGGRLFGLGVAIAWYAVCYFFLWKRFAPLVAYGSQPVMMAGCFLFGSTLGWHPWLAAKVRGATSIPESPEG